MEKALTKEGVADTSHAHIFYKISGHGIPLLMLHGNSETHHVFAYYEKRLSEKYQTILMDSRAHGRSHLKPAYTKKDFSTADMAGDVAALLDNLHINACILFGFSDGANIALEFASLFPSRTIAVIAVSGNISPDGLILPVRLFSIGQYYFLKAATLPLEHLYLKNISLKNARVFLPHHRVHHLFRHRQLASLLCNSPMITKRQLQSITAPVLLIAGTRDVIKVSHSRQMAECIPDAKLILVKGATHTAIFHHEKFYLKMICEFLDTL